MLLYHSLCNAQEAVGAKKWQMGGEVAGPIRYFLVVTSSVYYFRAGMLSKLCTNVNLLSCYQSLPVLDIILALRALEKQAVLPLFPCTHLIFCQKMPTLEVWVLYFSY